MKIAQVIYILSFIAATTAFGAPDPYVIESKVQQDLENALSRLISRDQFLVQATADVQVDVERKLVEGETVANVVPKDPEEDPPPTMPGFVPEPSTPQPKIPNQTREVFKTIDVPTLRVVRVHVNFDDQLPLATVTRARLLVENYLGTNYKDRAHATYGQLPMINPDKKKEMANDQEKLIKKLEDWDKTRDKKEPTIEEQAWRYGRWSALLFLVVIVLTLFLKPQINRFQHLYSGKVKDALPPSAPNEGGDYAGPRAQTPDAFIHGTSLSSGNELTGGRRQLLDRFLIRSEVFRIYYEKLSNDQKNELYACLRGPGYERLMDGLGLPIPSEANQEPAQVDEFLSQHYKSFDELAKAVDWQDRQLFGFSSQLTDGQLRVLASHVNANGLAMMLRFMKPKQSATVLDALPAARRHEVLSAVRDVMSAPPQEIQRVEKEVRGIVQQLPNQFYGTKSEDVTFWGKILSESEHQDEILDAMEKTNPEIYPNLKKFKFTLEDAASLPNNLLQKILSNVDNEELGQALATCNEEVAEVILDSVSDRRRQVLRNQIYTFRNAPKEQLVAARSSLTRRLREVLA